MGRGASSSSHPLHARTDSTQVASSSSDPPVMPLLAHFELVDGPVVKADLHLSGSALSTGRGGERRCSADSHQVP